MFRSRCIKPLLIILALSLASCVQEPRYASQSAPSAEHAQNPPNFLQHPDAIICAVPGAQPRRIEVPDGRNPTDFCPASRTTARIYRHDPNVNYPLPKVSGNPPPGDLLSLETQQDNRAALELRNKTPGQLP
jgi:hypothetical protein